MKTVQNLQKVSKISIRELKQIIKQDDLKITLETKNGKLCGSWVWHSQTIVLLMLIMLITIVTMVIDEDAIC